MTQKMQLRQWTCEFDEIRELIAEHKSFKKKLRSIDRKLKSVETKYGFLNDITSIEGGSTVIEIAAKHLFKSAGFTDVRHLKKIRPQREDLQIWCDDCIIIVECKGLQSPTPPNDEVGAVKKYVDFRKKNLQSTLPVFGLTVINHDNSKLINDRHKFPIDELKKGYAIAGEYGVVTTIELVNGFILLKNKDITFEEFKSTIKQIGLIKFSVRTDKP
jgi:hypothetical protein